MTIYPRIRELRENLSLTQTDMAEFLGTSQRSYSRYENGERGIPIDTLIQLANYHHTSVDYLVGLTDTKKPYKRGEKTQ